MPSYGTAVTLVTRMTAGTSEATLLKDVVPRLIEIWIDNYARSTARSEIVETEVSGFSYLFDIAHGRLIAAWGISRGKHTGIRDSSRMAGHPLSAGPRFHRGHAIPHTLGGPTDINLVAQLGSVNIGPFRALERRAVANPGALYFTYWIYGRGQGQKPISVEQGFLCPGHAPDIRVHAN